jgi:hypothetical protein
LFIFWLVFYFQFSKFTKVQCNGSNSCSNKMFCNVKPISKYTSSMSFSCQFSRPVPKPFVTFQNHSFLYLNWWNTPFQVDLTIQFKGFGKNEFVCILNQKKLDWCSIMENLDKFEFMKGLVSWASFTFPGLIHACPYTVRLK